MIFVIVLLVAALLVYMAAYNSLISARNKAAEAWSDIDVQLKRRHDLIPNLIGTVKGYADHEREVLEALTQQRAKAVAVSADPKAVRATAESGLSSALRSVFAVAENYPQLKADQNFLELQEQLSETEDQIAASRRIYNGNVQILNSRIESFPTSIIAGIQHIQPATPFQMTAEEAASAAKPVSVSF